MSRPMSRNGYSWVEGRVADGRDPSGHSLALAKFLQGGVCNSGTLLPFYPQLDCFAFCDGRFDEVSCLVNCEAERESSRRSLYLDSSVLIILAGDASGNGSCQQLSLAAGGLGTLTNEGLWTHDHFTGIEPNFYDPAENPDEAKAYLLGWPCIVITGRNGQTRIKGIDLQIASSTNPGTLRFENMQTTATGGSVDLRTLGCPASVNRYWDHNQTGLIYAAHLKGFNGPLDEKWLNHANVGLFTFAGVEGAPNFERQRLVYLTQQYLTLSSMDVSQEGDSGGGVFLEGALIGVTYRENTLDFIVGRNGLGFVAL